MDHTALVHGLLEASSSKRAIVSKPGANVEVAVCLAILAVLLIVRIPLRIDFAGLRPGRAPTQAAE